MGTEQDMATYKIAPIFNYETGKMELLGNKNKPVNFTYIPQSLDGRGGMENRTTGYMQADMLSPRAENTVEIKVPFIVSPKGWFAEDRPTLKGWKGDAYYGGSYTLIQGNTRNLYLSEQFAQIEADWQAICADESIPGDQKQEKHRSISLQFYPFEIQVLDSDSASNLGYIMWLQRAVNDAVRTQDLFQNIQMFASMLEFLETSNQALPKDQQRSKADLKAEACQPFGIKPARAYHYIQALRDFPDWMKRDWIQTKLMSFDCGLDMTAAYKRIEEKAKELNKARVLSFTQFFDEVQQFAISAKGDATKPLKIVPKNVEDAEASIMKDMIPEELAPPTGEGQEGSGDGGSGEGSGSGGDGKSDKTPAMTDDEVATELTGMLNAIPDKLIDLVLVTGNTDEGKPIYAYDNKDMIRLYKQIGKLNEVLASLMTVQQKEAAALLVKQQKEAEKAAAKLNTGNGDATAVVPSEGEPATEQQLAAV